MLRLSTGGRMRGSIKTSAEDFVVNEITRNGTVLETGKTYSHEDVGMNASEGGKFSVFVMQKTNWNTAQALKTIARIFKHGAKSAGFAGTKDRISISTQLCSIFGVRPDDLLRVHVKDISINGAWASGAGVRIGELLGNRFSIRIRNSSQSGNPDSIREELGGIFPNYFGEQRFGVRGNNVDVGLGILKGDFRSATMAFLADSTNEIRQEAVEARKRIAEEMDFRRALDYFPSYLKYERLVIEYLARFPDNYANALRRLPRQLSLMFVHSVEAEIFNRELEDRVRNKMLDPVVGELACGTNSYGFPDIAKTKTLESSDNVDEYFAVGNLVGYKSGNLTPKEGELMDEMGITADSFRARGMNELNSKGTTRVLFAPYGDMALENADGTANFTFSLPAGSYATVLLDEFVDKA